MPASGFQFDVAVQALVVKFSESVLTSLSTSSITLDRTYNGITETIPAANLAVAWSGATSTATFTFPGYPSGMLPDGNYVATFSSTGIQDAAGNGLAPVATIPFFFLAGDANHDHSVGFDDLLILAQNYGLSGRSYSQGNFDYSVGGTVGFDDLLLLAQRYGSSVVLAAAPAKPAATRSRVATGVLSA